MFPNTTKALYFSAKSTGRAGPGPNNVFVTDPLTQFENSLSLLREGLNTAKGKKENRKLWDELKSQLIKSNRETCKLGLKLVEELHEIDTVAEEVALFIMKTLVLNGAVKESTEIMLLAMNQPAFQQKERALDLLENLEGPELVVIFSFVLQMHINGNEDFTASMARQAIYGLRHEKNTEYSNSVAACLSDEESEAFSAAIDYFTSLDLADYAPTLAIAIQHGGSKEDILKVLPSLRKWQAAVARPYLEEMLKLDWVNLDRTRPIKKAIKETIDQI